MIEEILIFIKSYSKLLIVIYTLATIGNSVTFI